MKRETVIVIDFGGQYNQLLHAAFANVTYTVRFILIKQTLKQSKQ